MSANHIVFNITMESLKKQYTEAIEEEARARKKVENAEEQIRMYLNWYAKEGYNLFTAKPAEEA